MANSLPGGTLWESNSSIMWRMNLGRKLSSHIKKPMLETRYKALRVAFQRCEYIFFQQVNIKLIIQQFCHPTKCQCLLYAEISVENIRFSGNMADRAEGHETPPTTHKNCWVYIYFSVFEICSWSEREKVNKIPQVLDMRWK